MCVCVQVHVHMCMYVHEIVYVCYYTYVCMCKPTLCPHVQVDQFDSVGLSVFNNCWSTVHDFDRSTGDGNWSIEQGETPLLIDMPKEGEFVEVGVSFTQENSVVPLTVGPKQHPPGEVSKVCENESNS